MTVTSDGLASFDFDTGMYGGNVQLEGYSLPADVYVGFSDRTGGGTNNHWVRRIATSRAPPPPLPTAIPVTSFTLSGDATLRGDEIEMT